MNWSYRIDARRLYKHLGIPCRHIPKGLEGTYPDVPIYDSRGNFITHVRVMIFAATGAYAKHRIYVRCPKCDLPIPFGRLHQHIDTKTCVRHRPIALQIDTSANVRNTIPMDLADEILDK